MPQNDAIIFRKRGERKNLRLILDDGDDILSCVKQAMAEHKIEEAKIEALTGVFKEGEMNYFEGNKYKNLKLDGRFAFLASGHFKLNFNELYGSVHISVNERHPITGTLVRGKGTEGFEVKVSFIELHDK